MALPYSLKMAWKDSIIRKGFRKVFPEGSFKSVLKFLKRNYGHVVYAPIWMCVLLGFHFLFVHDPTYLTGMVNAAVPWFVPQGALAGVMEWLGQATVTMATSQPIYTTVFAWLLISFGIGGLNRWWSKKDKTGKTVSKYDYYKCNSLARILHIVFGVVCIALLVMCYFPQLQGMVSWATGMPLETALRTGAAAATKAVSLGLETAARTVRAFIDAMMALQWPSNGGILPFVFTMAWNFLTMFFFYAFPKILGKFCEHHKLWRHFEGTGEDQKKKRMKELFKKAHIGYWIVVALVSAPMIINIVFQFLTLWNFTLPSTFAVTPIYTYVYTLTPILLIPLFVILKAFQFNTIKINDTFAKERKEGRPADDNAGFRAWFFYRAKMILKHHKMALVMLILLLIFTGFFYTFIHYVFNFDAIPGFVSSMSGMFNTSVDLMLWLVRSLTTNMSWVAPFTWTFGVAAVFSLLLAFVPTFLDSKIGGLMYLPAFHFFGQAMMMMVGATNVPLMVMVLAMGTVQVLTAVALVCRNWGFAERMPLFKFLVPWYDEFRGLVADD
jgi:hypothetical protein